MKSGVVQLAMEYEDETHLVLYTWEIRCLMNYPFCEFQGLKGAEIDKFIPHENYETIRTLCNQ